METKQVPCVDCKGTGTEMEYDRHGDGYSHCCGTCKGTGLVKAKKPVAIKITNH